MFIRFVSMFMLLPFFFLPCFSMSVNDLKSPQVALAKNTSLKVRDAVDQILKSTTYKFIDGERFQTTYMLRYQGSTIALSKFLNTLADCEGIVVRVMFVEPPSGGHFMSGVDWVVHQEAGENLLLVRINSSSDNFKITELTLPDL